MGSLALNYILCSFHLLPSFILLLSSSVAIVHWLVSCGFSWSCLCLTGTLSPPMEGRWILTDSPLEICFPSLQTLIEGWVWNSIHLKTEEEISLMWVQSLLKNVSLTSLMSDSVKRLVKGLIPLNKVATLVLHVSSGLYSKFSVTPWRLHVIWDCQFQLLTSSLHPCLSSSCFYFPQTENTLSFLFSSFLFLTNLRIFAKILRILLTNLFSYPTSGSWKEKHSSSQSLFYDGGVFFFNLVAMGFIFVFGLGFLLLLFFRHRRKSILCSNLILYIYV